MPALTSMGTTSPFFYQKLDFMRVVGFVIIQVALYIVLARLVKIKCIKSAYDLGDRTACRYGFSDNFHTLFL